MSIACMLHAHLAYIYRNVEAETLDSSIVFTLLASQIFIFNNFKYDLDIDVTSKGKQRKDSENISGALIIPQVELFDMFQRNRTKVLQWLSDHPEYRNAVMDAVLMLG